MSSSCLSLNGAPCARISLKGSVQECLAKKFTSFSVELQGGAGKALPLQEFLLENSADVFVLRKGKDIRVFVRNDGGRVATFKQRAQKSSAKLQTVDLLDKGSSVDFEGSLDDDLRQCLQWSIVEGLKNSPTRWKHIGALQDGMPDSIWLGQMNLMDVQPKKNGRAMDCPFVLMDLSVLGDGHGDATLCVRFRPVILRVVCLNLNVLFLSAKDEAAFQAGGVIDLSEIPEDDEVSLAALCVDLSRGLRRGRVLAMCRDADVLREFLLARMEDDEAEFLVPKFSASENDLYRQFRNEANWDQASVFFCVVRFTGLEDGEIAICPSSNIVRSACLARTASNRLEPTFFTQELSAAVSRRLGLPASTPSLEYLRTAPLKGLSFTSDTESTFWFDSKPQKRARPAPSEPSADGSMSDSESTSPRNLLRDDSEKTNEAEGGRTHGTSTQSNPAQNDLRGTDAGAPAKPQQQLFKSARAAPAPSDSCTVAPARAPAKPAPASTALTFGGPAAGNQETAKKAKVGPPGQGAKGGQQDEAAKPAKAKPAKDSVNTTKEHWTAILTSGKAHTVPELKAFLSAHGQKVGGKKEVLIVRARELLGLPAQP